VNVSISEIGITMNTIDFNDNLKALYPFAEYRGITYMPLTYYNIKLSNLSVEWSQKEDIIVTIDDAAVPKAYMHDELETVERECSVLEMSMVQTAVINNCVVDSDSELYPILKYNNIFYVPLTWRICVDLLGWKYEYTKDDGISLWMDNYVYTLNGESYIEGDTYVSKDNVTYYKKDGIIVVLETLTSKMGPTAGNLVVCASENEFRPPGYYGYYRKNEPQFRIDGKYIETTYYVHPNERIPIPCRVNIETGEVIALYP